MSRPSQWRILKFSVLLWLFSIFLSHELRRRGWSTWTGIRSAQVSLDSSESHQVQDTPSVAEIVVSATIVVIETKQGMHLN